MANNPTGFTTVITGQQECTASPVQLPQVSGSQIVLSALKANTNPLYVGPSPSGTPLAASNGLQIEPGASVMLPIADLSMLYLIGTSGDYVSWAAMY